MIFSRPMNQSKWAGKRWHVIGDSITAPSTSTRNYHDYVKDKLGCIVNNYGISGTGWRTPTSGVSNAFYQRISSLDNNVDLITVFGGTNDWSEVMIGMTLGVFGDTDPAASLYGAIESTLSQLVNKFPTKTIAVFTPMQRSDAWYNLVHTVTTTTWAASTVKSVGDYVLPTTSNGYVYKCTVAGTTGATQPTWPTTLSSTVVDGTVTWQLFRTTTNNVSLQDISSAIIAVANKYNIPVLDLYKNGNMYAQNGSFRTAMMPDGLHPNDDGHKVLADKILAFLDTL